MKTDDDKIIPFDEVQRYVLGRAKVGAQVVMGQEMINSIGIRAASDIAGDNLKVSLWAYLRGGRIHKTVQGATYVPETWWDAVKERWFPIWILRWRPAQHRAIPTEVSLQHVCPHSNRCSEQAHLEFMTLGPRESFEMADVKPFA